MLKIGTIVYNNFNLVPLLFNSCESTSQANHVTVTYEIGDTYKYPFYWFSLNEDFLKLFENELKKIDARIKKIDENNIKIEKMLELADVEIEKKCHSDLENCLNNFVKKNFSQFKMKNIDESPWPHIRNRAIHFCNKNNKINLIYKNNPYNLLRIDGEKELIEKFVRENKFSNENIV